MAIRNRKTGAVTHEGFVLAVEWGQMYTYDPISYRDAVVFNPETGQVERVTVEHEYWAQGEGSEAKVDATPEVVAAARESLIPKEIAGLRAQTIRAWQEAVIEAHEIARGARVEVVRGRNIQHGVTGTVAWLGADKYRRDATRVGVNADLDGSRFYTDARNLRVIDVDPPLLSEYEGTDEEYLAAARERVAKYWAHLDR